MKTKAEDDQPTRRLKAGEVFEAGDIYGGDEWGFLFAIGSSQVQTPKPGDVVTERDANSSYRYRRKI